MRRQGATRAGFIESMLPRKATALVIAASVPQTDTGGIEEYSKVLELGVAKELCKLVP